MKAMRTAIFYSATIIILAGFLALLIGCGSGGAASRAEQLYGLAQMSDRQWEFTEARIYYTQAREVFLDGGNTEMADLCRDALLRITLFEQTYPYTAEELLPILKAKFSSIPDERIVGWFADGTSLEHITIDGITRYLDNPPIIDNIKYRNLDLFLAEGNDRPFVEWIMTNYVDQPRPDPSVFYSNPKNFHALGTLAVPRSALPATGTLRIWIPLPIVTGPQPTMTINSITPAAYLETPPGGEDIGLAYMEVPLAELAGDLNIVVDFSFTHYEQHFAVNPAHVGAYNTGDSEYIQYTRSYGNETITPDIRETARRVVGSETNPYLAAKKLYDYVIDNITYSLPPATLWPYGTPASVYVHTNRIGDCGCQSMYFSALCRSIGIPARATGGKQMLNHGEYSDHFWAEFYLPNYGWVPVDTSVGQLEYYTTGLTYEVRRAFREYYFGHQDNLRLVIQKDVDIPVTPAVQGGILYVPGGIQNPDGTCDTMDVNTITGKMIQQYWTLVEVP